MNHRSWSNPASMQYLKSARVRWLHVHHCVCMCASMHVRMYACMHVCMHVCIYVCMYNICIYGYVHPSIYQSRRKPRGQNGTKTKTSRDRRVIAQRPGYV